MIIVGIHYSRFLFRLIKIYTYISYYDFIVSWSITYYVRCTLMWPTRTNIYTNKIRDENLHVRIIDYGQTRAVVHNQNQGESISDCFRSPSNGCYRIVLLVIYIFHVFDVGSQFKSFSFQIWFRQQSLKAFCLHSL